MPPCFAYRAAGKPAGCNKTHLQNFGDMVQTWMISQAAGEAEGLEQLVCDERRCEALRLRPKMAVTDLSFR